MRILNVVTGVTVLFTALAFEHMLFHTFVHHAHDSAAHKAVMIGVGALGVLSFVGGLLLFSRKS